MPDLNYEGMYQRRPFFLDKIRPNIEDLKRRLLPEDELLDAGCCEGHLYEWLGHRNYTGIDIVHKNIEAAKERLPEVRFEVGDIRKLDRQWDVVFCSRVLMHLPDYEKNVEILRKNARKWLIVVVPVGPIFTDMEEEKGGAIMYRSFGSHELEDSKPFKLLKHPTFSTVIYSCG